MSVIHKNPRFLVHEVDVNQHGGSKSKHYFVKKNDAVLVVITHNSHVLVLHNDRPLFSTTSIELPGGAIDVGEAPLDAAFRELKEETSIEKVELQPLGITVPLPSLVTETVYLFSGELLVPPILKLSSEAKIEGISRYEWLPIDSLDSLLGDGKVQCSVDAYALSLLFMRELKT